LIGAAHEEQEMTVNFGQAIAAYRKAAEKGQAAGVKGPDAKAGDDFASFLRDAADRAVEILRTAEASTLEAAAGKADINDVVIAVTKAELTLQTVVTVRDRAVQTYQEVQRMPI
jgi:flagellar hook-basal body complex protein FliE